MNIIGLIGKKLSHSFSKDYYEGKIQSVQLESEICFRNFELNRIDELTEKVLHQKGLLAFHVTIPYKQEVLRYCNSIDREVKKCGSANFILIRGKQILAMNTDALAFRKSLLKQFGPNIKNALVLGNGGASKAVQYVLKGLGIEFDVVSTREIPGTLNYDELSMEFIKNRQLIVNTTSLGMYPNVEDFPKIPYSSLTDQHLLFDLIYNPEESLFLRKGKDRGAKGVNGLEMLHLQADAAWDILCENYPEIFHFE